MGSLRGRLTSGLAALLLPGAAGAEVCDKLRPGWSPADGPLGALGETLHIVASPFGLCLTLVAALALWLRWRWLAVLVALVAAPLLAALLLGRGAEVAVMARAEGCIGPALRGVALLLILPVVALWRAFRR